MLTPSLCPHDAHFFSASILLRLPYPPRATKTKMASNPPPNQPLHAYVMQIRDRIVPLANFLDSQWLDFCSKQKTLLVSGIVPQPAETLGHHYHYKDMPDVRYYKIVYAWSEGLPFALCDDPGDELRKAVLTRCTCEDVAIVFWEYLERKLKGIFCHCCLL